MEYTDTELQEHELDYWIRGHRLPFHHEKFYKQFFEFEKLKNKKVMEFGCGGCPITEYCNVEDIDITLVDPLLDKLIHCDRYFHLSEKKIFSCGLLEFPTQDKFDFILGFNVMDHFNDPNIRSIDKMIDLLNINGQIWLYYDVRDTNSENHLSINHELLLDKIKTKFNIIKLDETINPTHLGWSNIKKSIRLKAQLK